jgi:hypothetical protein
MVRQPMRNQNLKHLGTMRNTCKSHKFKGHTMKNCMRLKHIMQDLIDKGQVDVKHFIGNKGLKNILKSNSKPFQRE